MAEREEDRESGPPVGGLETCAQANQSINRDAHDKIDGDSPIHLKALVTQRVRKVREQREIVDGVSEKNRD